MISALNPVLVKSPPTSATHNTPWLGETAENATLILSAAKLGRAKTSASRTLNPGTGNFLLRDRDGGQNIMEPGIFLRTPRRVPKPAADALHRSQQVYVLQRPLATFNGSERFPSMFSRISETLAHRRWSACKRRSAEFFPRVPLWDGREFRPLEHKLSVLLR